MNKTVEIKPDPKTGMFIWVITKNDNIIDASPGLIKDKRDACREGLQALAAWVGKDAISIPLANGGFIVCDQGVDGGYGRNLRIFDSFGFTHFLWTGNDRRETPEDLISQGLKAIEQISQVSKIEMRAREIIGDYIAVNISDVINAVTDGDPLEDQELRNAIEKICINLSPESEDIFKP